MRKGPVRKRPGNQEETITTHRQKEREEKNNLDSCKAWGGDWKAEFLVTCFFSENANIYVPLTHLGVKETKKPYCFL